MKIFSYGTLNYGTSHTIIYSQQTICYANPLHVPYLFKAANFPRSYVQCSHNALSKLSTI